MEVAAELRHKIGTRADNDGGRRAFVATCSCGWESRPLMNAGMSASVGAHHRENPSCDELRA